MRGTPQISPHHNGRNRENGASVTLPRRWHRTHWSSQRREKEGALAGFCSKVVAGTTPGHSGVSGSRPFPERRPTHFSPHGTPASAWTFEGCQFPPAKGKGGACEPGDPACWCQPTDPADEPDDSEDTDRSPTPQLRAGREVSRG